MKFRFFHTYDSRNIHAVRDNEEIAARIEAGQVIALCGHRCSRDEVMDPGAGATCRRCRYVMEARRHEE